ncbi:hypothetical protein [Legionella cincinnatiensis]|uniref:Rod shape-determining protein MreB n=1 Tax=Legionella cincinnatiensis TaxID=28085 RepID=A0A378IG94_9GAMM|nr:hypothetical protein [Legionella cincinnatiensis]KTC82798.1 rod shape-determining protein MreB [Legionella cincinnatiensis]STX34229.1 rod shape-determining protein MreB [Legionella cincinnatiensis]
MKKGLYCFIVLFCMLTTFSQDVFSACSVFHSSGKLTERTNDALGLILFSEAQCPRDVFALRQFLKNSGLKIETTMVANRGFHNPSQGSFSLFEMALGELKIMDHHLSINAGDFFFGHFTAVSPAGDLVADQNPEKNVLMIEAFAWDPKKEVFNFYELRGDGTQGQWFYRGDSEDIFADNELLHRQPDPKHPQFGTRLRCSGCHGAGGPIMKELDKPHNDWWEPKRKLDFGGRKPDAALQDILETLVAPDQLSKSVLLGVNKLNYNEKFYRKKVSLSLQELLRPLFCPVELNLMSDIYPNDEFHSEVSIPMEFFIDSRFLPDQKNQAIIISRAFYEEALNVLGSHFPETYLQDADHAWLTPVKARSDKLAVDNLINNRVIDTKFMLDVLDIDRENPVFSPTRCSLLRLLPATPTLNWHDVFIKNLSKSKEWAAKKLLKNRTSPEQDIEFYQQKARKFLQNCQEKLKNSKNVEKMYRLLVQRRIEVSTSEISLNPLGQILEPGFRVIFPENERILASRTLKLTSACDVIEQQDKIS